MHSMQTDEARAKQSRRMKALWRKKRAAKLVEVAQEQNGHAPQQWRLVVVGHDVGQLIELMNSLSENGVKYSVERGE